MKKIKVQVRDGGAGKIKVDEEKKVDNEIIAKQGKSKKKRG